MKRCRSCGMASPYCQAGRCYSCCKLNCSHARAPTAAGEEE